MSRDNYSRETGAFIDKLIGDVQPSSKYRKPRGHEDHEFIEFDPNQLRKNKHDRLQYPDKDGYSKFEGRMSIFDLDNKRQMIALAVPNVLPPITKDDLRKLLVRTEEERKTDELLRTKGVRQITQPEPAKFVALVDADAEFDASRHDLWDIPETDALIKVTISAGKTALFDVAQYSNQATVLQTKLDELASGRLPDEQ